MAWPASAGSTGRPSYRTRCTTASAAATCSGSGRPPGQPDRSARPSSRTEASGGRANRVPASAASSAANAASTLAASGALPGPGSRPPRPAPAYDEQDDRRQDHRGHQERSDQQRMRAQERPRAGRAVPVRREGGPGGRVGPDPVVAPDPDLHPRVRVAAEQDPLGALRRATREPGDQPGRDTDRAQQHSLGRGEVLAEPLVRHEQEVVDGVRALGGHRGVEPVALVRVQVALDGCHLGLGRRGAAGQPPGQVQHPRGHAARQGRCPPA